MKILFLAPDVDLLATRGDSVHVRELSSQLVALGHAVTLVTSTGSIDSIPSVKHVERPRSTLRQVLQARRLARGWADIIYERRMSPKLSWTVSALTGVPFVIEVNGILEVEVRTSGRSGRPVGGNLKRRIRGRMFRNAALVVAVSRGIRDHLIARYALDPNRVIVVPNGANTSLLVPRDKGSCRLGLGLPADGPVICFVGNMVRWQGIDHLLHVLRDLRTNIPRMTVLLVGGGPDLDRLRSLASDLGVSDLVRFVGAVQYEDVPAFIGAADVCVAPFEPSRMASPIKVFEYLACGRPVVASDIDDIGGFLRGCRGGFAVTPENHAALADAIAWMFSHPVEAEEMGTRGRRAVEAERSWHETARRVAATLEAAKASRTGPGGLS